MRGVHINCPFAEPLYGEMDDTGLSWQQRLGDWWQDDKPWLREAPRLESEKQRDWFFWRQKRGVVVAGRMSAEEGKKVALWAQTLGWPLIGDVLSQTGQPLPCADLWLGNAKATSELQQAQIVVQLGSSLTGNGSCNGRQAVNQKSTGLLMTLKGDLIRHTIADVA